MQGNFEINSLEGNIVLPKENEPNRASRVHVLVGGEDGRVRGGPVQKLISKSPVQVFIYKSFFISYNPLYSVLKHIYMAMICFSFFFLFQNEFCL